MRSFKEIYDEMCDHRGFRYSIRELIHIFNNEQGNFPGEGQQVLFIKSYYHEITGIRAGECGGCNIATLKEVSRWIDMREKEWEITFEYQQH